MHILENHSLKSLNTFGVDVNAKWFVPIHSVDDLTSLISDPKWNEVPKLILGGGSNILFTKDFDGLVMHNTIKGVEMVGEDDQSVLVRAAGGEVWHDLVLFAISNGWGGIENLSLIPGFVGAAPIQNIGAYGAELSEVFHDLIAIDLSTGKQRAFSAEDCRFGYRYSVFKNEAKDQYVITSVSLRLSKKPQVNTSYGAIRDTLDTMQTSSPTIRDVSDAVIAIRRSKLPDPAEIGNAGSFFKNPVIARERLSKLQENYPEMPHYSSPSPGERGLGGEAKLSAAWLIEQAGWKGKRIGNVGMHAKQALVLVNHAGASGDELYGHAMAVKESVSDKFGIELEEEVRVI